MEAARHFDWNTREDDTGEDWKSCFISTFDCYTHAKNWAMMRSKWTDKYILSQPIIIYELDTSKLPAGTTILQATALCKTLDIDHPWMEDEWIFHQQIPAECIVRRYHPWTAYDRILEALCKYNQQQQSGLGGHV